MSGGTRVKRFVEGQDRSQLILLPECLDDYVGVNNPVRVVDAFIDELDLAVLGFAGVVPEATGRPSYHPAHSGERDQPYRLKVITDSGDCDHVDHERLKPGVMVATLHAADISVGCMGMVGPVKSAADRPRSPWRGPRAPRSALASDGAARAGRRCGPPWAIGARAVMQRGFRQRQDVGARMVP